MTGAASPQFFGRYQVTARLGQGGMAQVYRAYDPQLDREVAVKVIGGSLRGDPAFAERFRREARAVAALRHPHIVQVYDFGEDPQGYYMVMEYVPGPSLAEQLAALRDAGQRLPLAETLAILAQVADALDYAHDRGVVHRDVKPGNVLLRDGNSAGVVLADFGLALLRDRVTEATEGRSFGTPEYISPEQAMNSAAATPQSDIYSLGVMAYVMLTGNLPFTGDSPLAVAMAHVNTAPRRLRELAPDVPPGVETAVLQALAKNPAHRYRTAGAFVSAVRDALLRPSSAAPTRAVEPVLPTAQYTTPVNMVWPDAGREADGPPPTRAGMPAAAAALPEALPAPARRRLGWGWGLALLVLALCACGLAGGYLIASQLAGGLPGLPAIPAPPTRATALTAAPTAVTPTASATLAPSSTVEPSASPTDTPTATETPTATGTPTATSTPTLTPSATPTPTAQQMIFSLKDAIDLARQQGRIKNPVARDLQERLDGVLEKLNEGQFQEALDRLQAFRDYIGEQGSERRIPEDLVIAWQAQVDLIAAAIRSLGG